MAKGKMIEVPWTDENGRRGIDKISEEEYYSDMGLYYEWQESDEYSEAFKKWSNSKVFAQTPKDIHASLEELESHIKSKLDKIKKGFSRFQIIYGPGGWGKSYTAKDFLVKSKIAYEPCEADSPVKLYNFLYDNSQNKILLIDDKLLMSNPNDGSRLFKESCETNGQRKITWGKASDAIKPREPSCPFNSKVIYLTNQDMKKTKNPHITSAASRSDSLIHLSYTFEQKLALLYKIASKPFLHNDSKETLPAKKTLECYKFLASILTPLIASSPLFTIRTLESVFTNRLSNEKTWKAISKRDIESIPEQQPASYEFSRAAGTSVATQVQEIMKKTGISRASIYRHRKK